MTITPADIEAQRFPIVFRGYKVEDVDTFLDRLQADIAQLLADPAAESASTDSAGGPVDQPPTAAPDPSTPMAADPLAAQEGGHAARVLRTLARAEEMAEQTMADAVTEADGIRARAHGEAEGIVAAARAESDRVEAELNLRRQREVGALVIQTQQLRTEIDRLSGVERQYREGLQALLSEQQRLLDQRIAVVDAATADTLSPAA